MAKIIAHNTLDNVKLLLTTGLILTTLSSKAKALKLTNDKGKTTRYHWVDVAIKDNDGQSHDGSAMVWDKLLLAKPKAYKEGKNIDLTIQINGPKKGRGVAQVYLSSGKFDVARFLNKKQAKKFNLKATDEAVLTDDN